MKLFMDLSAHFIGSAFLETISSMSKSLKTLHFILPCSKYKARKDMQALDKLIFITISTGICHADRKYLKPCSHNRLFGWFVYRLIRLSADSANSVRRRLEAFTHRNVWEGRLWAFNAKKSAKCHRLLTWSWLTSQPCEHSWRHTGRTTRISWALSLFTEH